MTQEILAKNVLLWESKVADIQLSQEGAAHRDWMNHPLAFSTSAWTLTLASCPAWVILSIDVTQT